MRIYYDTEFLERGADYPVSLISIGMVREDGKELYLVNANAPWDDIYAHPWLRDNVLPHLPRDEGHTEEWRPDYLHNDVQSPRVIANAVSDFCSYDFASRDRTQLWGYYSDYDHVVLAQLFGTMMDLPGHMPMYTRDLKQAWDMLMGDREMAQQESGEHNALEDARWVRDRMREVDYVASDHWWLNV